MKGLNDWGKLSVSQETFNNAVAILPRAVCQVQFVAHTFL